MSGCITDNELYGVNIKNQMLDVKMIYWLN